MAVPRTPEARIPLPGKVWNLAERQEWETWLAQLRRHEHLVLLVELPPASVPEAVLLAESLPHLIWLVDSGTARARETREQLQTLRYGKCRLVGAVLNHEPKPVFEL
jgi:Mrp family chromosome partitioning ATPase